MKNPKVTDEIRQKWKQVMTIDFMSSEESGPDDDIIVHPLPWRSSYVNTMFSKIDKFNQQLKTPQARRQMKNRRVGSVSTRKCVNSASIPSWAIHVDLSD